MEHDHSAFDSQMEILKIELAQINGAIRQFDGIMSNIKNWAIVTWTASIGLAINDKALHPLLWLTALIPLLFWIVDGSFRRVQRSFSSRIKQISQFVNSQEFKDAAGKGLSLDFPLLMMRYKSPEFKNTLVGVMLFRTVSFLYVGLIVCSFIVWFIVKG